ncbi:MAG TPA: hypothetical protein VLL27_11575 [Solirubrobacterales bacterium]|nr:hypothetical protein [Solirubrobacterales bacterium]
MLVTVACVAVLTGCGGSGSSASSEPSSAPSDSTSASPKGSSTSVNPPSPVEADEPSAEFAGKGRNGELATAGKESTVAEREAASTVAEASFKAAESRDWAGQCATLSAELIGGLEENSKAGCSRSLEQLANKNGGAPENPMVEPLAALRVNGNLAFAFFHGIEKRDFVVPMVREGSQWKLAALLPEEAS